MTTKPTVAFLFDRDNPLMWDYFIDNAVFTYEMFAGFDVSALMNVDDAGGYDILFIFGCGHFLPRNVFKKNGIVIVLNQPNEDMVIESVVTFISLYSSPGRMAA